MFNASSNDYIVVKGIWANIIQVYICMAPIVSMWVMVGSEWERENRLLVDIPLILKKGRPCCVNGPAEASHPCWLSHSLLRRRLFLLINHRQHLVRMLYCFKQGGGGEDGGRGFKKKKSITTSDKTFFFLSICHPTWHSRATMHTHMRIHTGIPEVAAVECGRERSIGTEGSMTQLTLPT